MKNIKIPINTNFAVINEKPLCKIIPNIINDAPAVSIIPAACIREKTSGNLMSPIDPVKIKKAPNIKDIMDVISIETSFLLSLISSLFFLLSFFSLVILLVLKR